MGERLVPLAEAYHDAEEGEGEFDDMGEVAEAFGLADDRGAVAAFLLVVFGEHDELMGGTFEVFQVGIAKSPTAEAPEFGEVVEFVLEGLGDRLL